MLFCLVIRIVKHIGQSGNYGGTLFNKEDINWETVREAVSKVIRSYRHLLNKSSYMEIESACIDFIFSDNKDATRLRNYAYKEKTEEKVNKLFYSLKVNPLWIDYIDPKDNDFTMFSLNETDIEDNAGPYTIRKTYNILDKKQVAIILKQYFETGKIEDENTSILVNQYNQLTKVQKSTLEALYKDNLKINQVAEKFSIHRDTVADRRDRALKKMSLKGTIPVYKY